MSDHHRQPAFAIKMRVFFCFPGISDFPSLVRSSSAFVHRSIRIRQCVIHCYKSNAFHNCRHSYSPTHIQTLPSTLIRFALSAAYQIIACPKVVCSGSAAVIIRFRFRFYLLPERMSSTNLNRQCFHFRCPKWRCTHTSKHTGERATILT